MKKYIQSIFSFAIALAVSVNVTAQTAVVIESENFNATTLPTNWVTFGNDPVDPAASSQVLSPGWTFGETSYAGFWNVPASPTADGFAISNDDDVDQDKSLDFLGSPLLDLTGYDSLTLTFDLFLDGAFGSTGTLILSNNPNFTDAVSFTLPTFGAWNEGVNITIANGEELLAGIPFTFTNQMVFGFIHDDALDWGSGVAVDNFEVVGFLPVCEATVTQVPASAVAAVGGSTTTISTTQNTGGEYSVVTNVTGSTEYDIAHSGGAYVTVRTGSASGPILDAGFTPLTITTLSTDDLYLVWTDDEFCATGGGTATNTSSITGGAAVCAADAGTLETVSNPNACLGDELVAAADVAPSVPAGFSVAYVVTDGAGNVLDGPFANPTYTPVAAGTYFIHTMVYDPADQLTILGQAGNGAQAVADLFEENGGALCGSLDLAGAGFLVVDCPDNNDCEDATPLECGSAVAGTNVNASLDINTLGETVWYTFQGNGQDVTFSNCADGDFDSFISVWSGDCAGLDFLVGNDDGPAGCGFQSEVSWYMHPDTLYRIAVSGLGQGAVGTFTIEATCTCPAGLDAGTLTPDAATACLDGNGEAVLSGTQGTAPQVPEGYDVAYVLTSGGTDYIIEQTGATPDFTVTAGGEYTIHTLVFTSTLDLSVVDPGVTPASAVLGIVAGDDNICAALDVTGTGTITVNAPEAGTLTADANPVCFTGSDVISATEGDAPVVPAGYEVVYVLTEGAGLTIQGANSTPEFTVTAEGEYTIHTLVVPVGTDLAPFVGGSAAAVVTLIDNGTICAALDVDGASVSVSTAACNCTADAGSLTAGTSPVCVGGTISATENVAPVVPAGYSVLYVLTEGAGLVIVDAGTTPSFTATAAGDFTIHTLVYDPLTLDPTSLPAGATGFDVNALLIQGGGTICGALDVTGASVTVDICTGIQETLDANVSVYPNPSNGEFVIEVDGVEGDAQIVVTDVAGRQVYTEGVIMNASFRTEVNLNVATGTYLLQLVTVEGTVTRKIQID